MMLAFSLPADKNVLAVSHGRRLWRSPGPCALMELDVFEPGLVEQVERILIHEPNAVLQTLGVLDERSVRLGVIEAEAGPSGGRGRSGLISHNKPCRQNPASWRKHAVNLAQIMGDLAAEHVREDAGRKGKIDSSVLCRENNVVRHNVAAGVVVTVPCIDVMELEIGVGAGDRVLADIDVNLDHVEADQVVGPVEAFTNTDRHSAWPATDVENIVSSFKPAPNLEGFREFRAALVKSVSAMIDGAVSRDIDLRHGSPPFSRNSGGVLVTLTEESSEMTSLAQNRNHES
jgi:hypothetical protein